MERNFMAMIHEKWGEGKFVCVGLDSDYQTICQYNPDCSSLDAQIRWPDVGATIFGFNRAIVEATRDVVCAYKPNMAFYEAYGEAGLGALKLTISFIHQNVPGVPVILDAKRADIGNTNNGYVQMAFEYLKADAITIHPYLGAEALQPFLDRADKGIIVLCRTSNPGAKELQDLIVEGEMVAGAIQKIPLYKHVAHLVSHPSHWNKNGNCAVVAGATFPYELREVREIVGDTPILIPGVGFQQKGVPLSIQVSEVVENGMDSRGEGMIINSSRGIIFASKGSDFAEAARRETLKLHEEIGKARAAILAERSGG